MTAIITTLGVALITGVVNIVIALINKNNCERNSAKQSILQLINEDYIAVEVRHQLPTNYTRILYENDKYEKKHGNSYVHEKVNEYIEWYSKLELE